MLCFIYLFFGSSVLFFTFDRTGFVWFSARAAQDYNTISDTVSSERAYLRSRYNKHDIEQ